MTNPNQSIQKARRFVRLFQKRFVESILSGSKFQTVRPAPKRQPRPGDMISLRCWTGKPYRSKQRILGEAEILTVKPVMISRIGILVQQEMLSASGQRMFAARDGFNSIQELLGWFDATHGLPFSGIVIRWMPLKG